MEPSPSRTADIVYPWKFIANNIEILTDTYLSSLHSINVLRDMFQYEVVKDPVLIEESISLYSDDVTSSDDEHQMILKSKGVDVCCIRGPSKYQVCMVVYFMDMYYANEAESERNLMKDPKPFVPYYSHTDRPALIEEREAKRQQDKELRRKKKGHSTKKIQKAFIKAIMSDEFSELVKKFM